MKAHNKFIATALVAASLLFSACGQNYSIGTRVGVITKLSHKGLVWESWEGELLMALPVDVAGTTTPEKWAFNVDPSAVEKVKSAMASGKRVELMYRQWLVGPPSTDSNYIVVDVK